MEELQTLLNQIASKDLVQAEKTFNSLLKIKAYDQIQDQKPEIANKVFGDLMNTKQYRPDSY